MKKKMKKHENTSSGKKYQTPVISLVRIDQEISLSMVSYPDDPGDDFFSVNTPDLVRNDSGLKI
jgi:hypothetical protein